VQARLPGRAGLAQLAAGVESAFKTRLRAIQIVLVKVRRDSQGSLPKTAASTYLDDNAMEL
jgi:hypothetical protein